MQQKIESRSEAIRRLVEDALAAQSEKR